MTKCSKEIQPLTLELTLSEITTKLRMSLPVLSGEILDGALLTTADVPTISQDRHGNMKVNGMLRLISDPLSLNLHVEASTPQEISMSCSKFNMASAKGCNICISLKESDVLCFEFTAPDAKTQRSLEKFFKFTSTPAIS